MAVRKMDIFGDDSTEDVDSDDIFYHSSAEKSKIFNAERSESEDAHYRDREWEKDAGSRHSYGWERRPQYHYEHSPHHSGNVQKSNVSPIIKLLGLVLLVMGVIFVIKGHPEYSAVVVLVIIMYVLNFFTINKKGSGSRRQR